jgi:hypothetical protein
VVNNVFLVHGYRKQRKYELLCDCKLFLEARTELGYKIFAHQRLGSILLAYVTSAESIVCVKNPISIHVVSKWCTSTVRTIYKGLVITRNKLRGLSPQARTIPTERPPLVGEVSANFSEQRASRCQRNEPPTVVNFGFLDQSRYFLEIVQLSSRG